MPVSTFGRSVVDFPSASELDKALQTVTPQGTSEMDWMLPIPDPNAEEQTQEGEMQRLMALKSYMLLDAEREEVFDQLTREAREVFGVPTSLISLIDMGRQFLFSNTGADVKETNRNVAFCSYTILQKERVNDGLLVVNDTHDDFRFKDGPLVQDGPKLRFYAGAPLLSPEGYKLGTFCIEGPEPRPEGLTDTEKGKLKEYAAKTMELMVERRKRLRDKLSGDMYIRTEWRNHAGVATCLGDYILARGVGREDENQLVEIAMRLYQESIQTLMLVDDKNQPGDKETENKDSTGSSNSPKSSANPYAKGAPSPERQQSMRQLLTLFLALDGPDKDNTTNFSKLKEHVMALYQPIPAQDATKKVDDSTHHGISGLFHTPQQQHPKGHERPLPPLVFSEVFRIDVSHLLSPLKPPPPENDGRKRSTTTLLGHVPLSMMPFSVPLDECSKATLFNMAQIHYHYWGNQETAMQLFHLAASVSHKISPLEFDPVDISCINNMAQIHFQVGHVEDALKMLTETLDRANRALTAMYRRTEVQAGDEDGEITPSAEVRDALRTSRLRRKIARTMINLACVNYYCGNLDVAMEHLKNAIPVVDRHTMTGRTLAAIAFNMALVLRSQKKFDEALVQIDEFLQAALKFNGADHLQNAEALVEKASILLGLERCQDAVAAADEALAIRTTHVGQNHVLIAETLALKGRILMEKGDATESALTCFHQALAIYRPPVNPQQEEQQQEDSFESAQIMMDIGRAQHAHGSLVDALATYQKVLEWARKFFGEEHPFVARISGIVGSILADSRGNNATNNNESLQGKKADHQSSKVAPCN